MTLPYYITWFTEKIFLEAFENKFQVLQSACAETATISSSYVVDCLRGIWLSYLDIVGSLKCIVTRCAELEEAREHLLKKCNSQKELIEELEAKIANLEEEKNKFETECNRSHGDLVDLETDLSFLSGLMKSVIESDWSSDKNADIKADMNYLSKLLETSKESNNSKSLMRSTVFKLITLYNASVAVYDIRSEECEMIAADLELKTAALDSTTDAYYSMVASLKDRTKYFTELVASREAELQATATWIEKFLKEAPRSIQKACYNVVSHSIGNDNAENLGGDRIIIIEENSEDDHDSNGEEENYAAEFKAQCVWFENFMKMAPLYIHRAYANSAVENHDSTSDAFVALIDPDRA